MSDFPSKISQVGPHHYRTELVETWSIGQILNGGYLQHVTARAALYNAKHPHPVAVTTDFLHRVRPGLAELHVKELRAGKTVQTLRVTLVQNDQAALVSSVIASSLTIQRADVDMAFQANVPSPEQCARISPDTLPNHTLGLMDHVEVRLAPECLPLLRGQADGSFTLRGWARLVNGQQPDPYVCLLAVDAFPPVTFTIGRYGWAPTMQLSTYIRALPKPGWLRAEVKGHVVTQGWFDEECVLRDTEGKVVAQSRQLVRLPAPEKRPAKPVAQ